MLPVSGPAARSAGGIRSSMADGPPMRTSRIGPEDTRPTDRSVARRLPTRAAPTSVTGMAAQAPDARRALVLHDRPLLADLIELTLNHGLFVVRAVESLAAAESILAGWLPDMAVVDMDHDDSALLLQRLGATNTMVRSATPILGLTRRGDLKTKLRAFEL